MNRLWDMLRPGGSSGREGQLGTFIGVFTPSILTILGIMGEAHKLLESERQRVLDIVMEQTAGRVPVVAGCTANSTHVAVHLAQNAEAAGAAAVMVAPPQNVKNEALLLEHYAAIADSISIPIVLQDEPVTTGVILTPDFIARLAEAVPAIRYVKLEEAPTPMKITKILEKTDRLEIFGGLGGNFIVLGLALVHAEPDNVVMIMRAVRVASVASTVSSMSLITFCNAVRCCRSVLSSPAI